MDEKIPMLYQKEKDAFIRLSSLDFSTAFNKGKPNLFPHRQVVFKGARWLEAKVNYYLEKEESGVTLTAREQVDIFNVFSKLGHLSLLAQDFARAFYAYQNALKRDADAFGRHPANHYGLGLTCLFFHHYHL